MRDSAFDTEARDFDGLVPSLESLPVAEIYQTGPESGGSGVGDGDGVLGGGVPGSEGPGTGGVSGVAGGGGASGVGTPGSEGPGAEGGDFPGKSGIVDISHPAGKNRERTSAKTKTGEKNDVKRINKTSLYRQYTKLPP
jgi:hypothetical protein